MHVTCTKKPDKYPFCYLHMMHLNILFLTIMLLIVLSIIIKTITMTTIVKTNCKKKFDQRCTAQRHVSDPPKD